MDKDSKIIIGFGILLLLLSPLKVVGIAFLASAIVYWYVIIRQYIMTIPIDDNAHSEVDHDRFCGGCTLKL